MMDTQKMLAYITTTLALLHVTSGLSAVTYDMREELALNTSVGDVKRDARLSDHHSQADLDSLRFSIIESTTSFTRDGSSYFAIHPETGVLRVARRIDRDVLCPSRQTCDFVFDVAVKPVEFFQVITVTVNIQDINDHTPVFPRPSVHLTIPESTPAQTAFALPAARDIDGYDLGISYYELDSFYEIYEVRARPNAREAINTELVVVGELDREKVSDYMFTITAYDGGSPRRTGNLLVNVTVSDINDNHPVFEQEQYRVQVAENSPPLTTVLTVSAVDLDEGVNSHVTYGFSPLTIADHGRFFAIDESTGAITLKEAVDHEIQSAHELVVTAQDAGQNSRLATATVTVTVTDVNDNRPRIDINTLTDDGQARILENADLGTFVVLMSVSDPDLAQNGNVECSVSSDLFSLQLIAENKYKIASRKRFDREEQDRYEFTVNCHDNGDPILSAEQVVHVVVADDNDHEPVFIGSPYRAEITENNLVGVSLLKLSATDDDIEENALISYSILNDFSQQFSVNPRTGVVTMNDSLDHERYSSVDLIVEARDNGRPPKSHRTTLTVDVLDVNDVPPSFLQDSPAMLVDENQEPDTSIGTLNAIDSDGPPFNVITYTVSAVEGSDLKVRVNPDTGEVFTTQILDREQMSVFHFRATASNVGYPGMNTSVTVAVYVSDVNDNAPIIDFPNSSNHTVIISNIVSHMDLVTQVKARDLDTDSNGRLTYSLVPDDQAASSYFGIDRNTGVIYAKRDLSSLIFERFDLVVKVTDGGKPTALSSFENLTVFVDRSVRPIIPSIPTIVTPDIDNTFNKPSGNDGKNKENKNNLVIIIAVVAASSVIILILLAAIIFVIANGRSTRKPSASRPNKVDDTVCAQDEFDEFKLRPDAEDNNVKKDVFMVELSPVEQEGGWSEGDKLYPPPPSPSPSPVAHPSPDHLLYVPDVVAHSRPSAGPAGPAGLKDGDLSDESCGDLSNADSGRGGSEEGESSHAGSNRPRAAPRHHCTAASSAPSPSQYNAMRVSVPNTSTFHPHPPSQTAPRRHLHHQPASLPTGSRTLTLPHQQSAPLRSVCSPVPPSPTPSDTPSASIRPSLRSCKLLDKYEQQREENKDAYRGSYSLLHNTIQKMDDPGRSPVPSPNPRSKVNNLNATNNGRRLATKLDVDNSFV